MRAPKPEDLICYYLLDGEVYAAGGIYLRNWKALSRKK
jgi:hypothetical protein